MKYECRKIKIAAAVLFLIPYSLFFIQATFAQGNPAETPLGYQIQVGLPGQPAKSTPSLQEYFTALYKLVLGLVVIAALLGLVIGGVLYITSGASTSLKGEARSRIESALMGILLIFFAILLLRTISGSFSSIVIPLPKVELPEQGVNIIIPEGQGGTLQGAITPEQGAALEKCISGSCMQLPLGSSVNGIGIDESACSFGGPPPGGVCYLQSETIGFLANIESLCQKQTSPNCQIVVTGAASVSMLHHSSLGHYNGCSVDVQVRGESEKLCDYIKTTITQAKQAGAKVLNGYGVAGSAPYCPIEGVANDPYPRHLHLETPNCTP